MKKWQTIGFICFAGSLGGLLFGFDTAVISGTLSMLQQQFKMTSIMQGWFVSSGLLGCIVGVTMAGALSNRIGRKKVLILSSFLFLLSGIGCGFAFNITSLILFRLIGGIGVGGASVISPMFIAEFAPAVKRGRMISYYQLAVTVGILSAYFSNALLLGISTQSHQHTAFFSWLLKDEVWRSMFLMMVLPSIVFMLMVFVVPESPRWLIQKGVTGVALQILNRVRPQGEALPEYEGIVNNVGAQQQNKKNTNLLGKGLRLTLLTGILLAVFQQFCGINAIIYYGPKILASAGFANESSLNAQVIIGFANMLFTWIAIMEVDKWGRKTLLITGLSGIILSLFMIGVCFWIDYTGSALLLLMLLLFIACFAFSLGPVTWILINELFPGDVRVKGVSVCTLAVWVSVWVVGQFFPWLLTNAGPSVTFWLFCGFSIADLIFCLKVLTETKGKTLEEIEQPLISPH